MTLNEKIMAVIGGPHPAAVATVDLGKPAVRFMVLAGFDDMTLVGGTMKSSKKVGQLKRNPDTSIAIWSGKDFADPYVEIMAKGEIHEDLATKKKFWNPMFEKYFASIDNPEFVVLKFSATEIRYLSMTSPVPEVWKR